MAFLTYFAIFSLLRSTWGEHENWKLSSAHIYECKIWLNHRTVLRFISLDRCNPQEACKHRYWVLESIRNIFSSLEVKIHIHPNPFFKDIKMASYFYLWETIRLVKKKCKIHLNEGSFDILASFSGWISSSELVNTLLRC